MDTFGYEDESGFHPLAIFIKNGFDIKDFIKGEAKIRGKDNNDIEPAVTGIEKHYNHCVTLCSIVLYDIIGHMAKFATPDFRKNALITYKALLDKHMANVEFIPNPILESCEAGE